MRCHPVVRTARAERASGASARQDAACRERTTGPRGGSRGRPSICLNRRCDRALPEVPPADASPRSSGRRRWCGRSRTRSRAGRSARPTCSPARAAPGRPRSHGSSRSRSTASLGPTAHPDNTCHACVAISNGTSLDVIEMDAASQRGIDDIREIRERVVLQPVEGRSKVYILDEAHQLTDAAWNALLKLIEEPPPHLLFIFCTTELAEGAADRALALPDVRVPAAAAARPGAQAPPDRRRRGDQRCRTRRSR